MQLSTVGRYALRAMVDLAIHQDRDPVQSSDVALRQEVSNAYLSQLFLKLKRANLVQSVRGPGGGYLLAREPGAITAGDVLRAVEETLDPVSCVGSEPDLACRRADRCPTHWLWEQLGEAIRHVLDSVTLADLCEHARQHGETTFEEIR